MGRWSSLLAPQLAEFGRVNQNGRALDVGSGTGVLSFALAKAYPRCQVVGIDPAKEYVAYAKSKNPYGGRVNFQTGDAQQLRFANGSFHSSLALLVFNFIPDSAKGLREVMRVTKPGGCISAAVWDYTAGMQMLRKYWDAVVAVDPAADSVDEAHMRLCRQGELGQLWKQGGMEQVEERPIDITTSFTSFNDYWGSFLLGEGPAGAYVKNHDEARRQAVRSELRRRLNVESDDRPITLPARAWAVRGVVPGGRKHG